ncbi:MAG: DUF6687 family protein [Planctomycetota bacterium]
MLPFVFASDPSALGSEPVVFVDGSPLSPDVNRSGDLHLSHWPGNRTPVGLKRDLSTDIAFALLELDASEREGLLADKRALVLNHLDTDGVCALFVLLRPEAARGARELLGQVAAAGDFFAAPSERAVAVDAALRNLTDPGRSAFAAELERDGIQGDARRARLALRSLDVLGDMLQDESAHAELWRTDLEQHRADARALEAAAFDDLVYLDFGVWTARPDSAALFDPGRHAFLGDGRLDRALLVGPTPEGTTARFVLGTRSFFDVVSRPASPRPDLDALTRALDAAEEAAGGAPDGCAWRAHGQHTPSPELWFGTEGLPLFPERAGAHLAPSRLDPIAIKAHVLDAVRATWTLPDDDDEAEDGEDIFAV